MSSLSLASRISRYYKLTPTRFFTSAAERREKYGGGGVHKFRLARRRADFFPAAAARHASGWRRRRNSAAQGSTLDPTEGSVLRLPEARARRARHARQLDPHALNSNSAHDDTDSHKNFGPDLLLKVLMFNMHKIWSFDSQKNYKNCCHQMSDFKAKMLTALPQTP